MSCLIWESGPAAVGPKGEKAFGISVFPILIPYLWDPGKPQTAALKSRRRNLRPRMSSSGGIGHTVSQKPGEKGARVQAGRRFPNGILRGKARIWPMLMPHMTMPGRNGVHFALRRLRAYAFMASV